MSESDNKHCGWRPLPAWAAVERRALMFEAIRSFMAKRDITEVTTPILGKYGATAVHLASFQVVDPTLVDKPVGYLQTSPEYALKKMLAHYQRDIYQIAPALRAGELGAQHRQEFTMLEWYRLGLEYMQLADEVGQLLRELTGWEGVSKYRYHELFQDYLGINLATTGVDELAAELHKWLVEQELSVQVPLGLARYELANYILDQFIIPQLPQDRLVLVYDYLADDAALAQLQPRHQQNRAEVDGGDVSNGYDAMVAQRFEFYYQGVELANGFGELNDPVEQEQRFKLDNQQRKQHGLGELAVDQELLASLPFLPPCSGVAVGIERLLMLVQGVANINLV